MKLSSSLAWYALAVLLVAVYVNTFAVWQALRLRLGDGATLVPWIVAAALVLLGVGFARRGEARRRVSPTLLALSLAVAVAGLLFADPEFPAKRIHVPQYALLSAVVWMALRRQVDAAHLALFTILVTALFGVHDEYLQGLHPSRTYGAADMLANLCGAVAGVLALAAFTGRPIATRTTAALPRGVVSGAIMAAIGLVLHIAVLVAFRGQTIPYWTALPLLAGVLALALALARDDGAPGVRHAGTTIVVLLALLSAYPVIANETPLDFA